MIEIKLNKKAWLYNPNNQIGDEGGFGIVYVGTSGLADEVAIKRLKLSAKDAAYRELRIAEEIAGKNFNHVIPILDSGIDANSNCYYIVMAKAEKSLQDEIESRKLFDQNDAVDTLLQIAEGLSELEAFVHRDLKPANILYHDGKWKISDFGISRFIEESTSLRTLKEYMSQGYAAPEQWRQEKATHATDIYALGCIGYALLTGNPPFSGPCTEDYSRQHCLENAPALPDTIKHGLTSLLLMMLRKNLESRPSVSRVIQILKECAKNEKEAISA